MTDTTPEQARRMAEDLLKENPFYKPLANSLTSLADQLEAVTADCEKFANQTFAARAEAKTLVDHVNSEMSRLTAERDALEKDAARYRWLCASFDKDGPHIYGPDDDCILDGECAEVAIDAAIDKEKS